MRALFSFASFLKKTQLFIKVHHFFCIWLSTWLSARSSARLPARLFKKDTTFYKSASFLLHLVICPVICPVIHPVICPIIHPVIRPVFCMVIRQVIRLVICPVICLLICPVIHPVIPCIPIWLTSSLSYPMAIFSANEIRTFDIYMISTQSSFCWSRVSNPVFLRQEILVVYLSSCH